MHIMPVNFAPMIHRGEIIERVVRENSYSITKLAHKLGRSRRYIYNLFEDDMVDWDTIRDIGKIINHDFSSDFKELRKEHLENMVQEPEPSYANRFKMELDECREELTQIKGKYIELLEKYNSLLAGQLKDKKDKKHKH